MKNYFAVLILFCLPFFSIQLHAQNIEDKYPVTILNPNGTKQLLFYFTGDGGINNFSEQLCNNLAQKKYTVIILNSRKYFWKQKLPDYMATQVSEIIQFYVTKLKKKEFSIIGYSFGADAAIFYNTRVPKNLLPLLKSTILLSPSIATDFTVKFADLLGIESSSGQFKTLPEILKIPTYVLCMFGEEEEEKQLYNGIANKKNIKRVLLPGSHKYDNDINKVVTTVLSAL